MSFFLNPWLLLGAGAVASPIIIHLLAKRRFRVVYWAAMDFLFDADKRNRRRVQLEHLILLLLRCLAMLLIAFLLARPFLSTGNLPVVTNAGTVFEHIFVLDDSASMNTSYETRTSWRVAKEQLLQAMEEVAGERPGDRITVFLTSKPSTPIIQDRVLSQKTREEIRLMFEGEQGDDTGLQPSDEPVDWVATVEGLQAYVGSNEESLNRSIYLVSDMRQEDWRPSLSDEKANPLIGAIQGLSETDSVEDVVVVDVGGEESQNLAIVGVELDEKALIAGTQPRFKVLVRNSGQQEARDVKVKASTGMTAVNATIPSIEPGQTEPVILRPSIMTVGPVKLTCEVESSDVMPLDNTYFYAGQARQGVRVMVVDGDPASGMDRPYEAESYYIARGLEQGDRATGVEMWVTDVDGFELLTEDRIRDAQLIYLLNVYSLTPARMTLLSNWVENGGGLVIYLGDRVFPDQFNEQFWQDGKGLSPAAIGELRGDPNRNRSVKFVPKALEHPVLKLMFSGETGIFMSRVKVFQYFQLLLDASQVAAGDVRVLFGFDDTDGSPAMVERTVGKGRVVLVATTADVDWNNWAEVLDYSFPILNFELVNYAARRFEEKQNQLAGQPIRQWLNPSQFKNPEAKFIPPKGEPVSRLAVRDESDQVPAGRSLKLELTDEDLIRYRGFYTIELTRAGDEKAEFVYASNFDPAESELVRVNEEELKQKLGEDVQVIRAGAGVEADVSGGRVEIWHWLLAFLVLALAAESFLAWRFGRGR